MKTELATLDLNQLPSTQLGSDESFMELAKGGDFLSYVKLFTKGKAIDTGKITPGHWGIPEADEAITDLGDSIDVLPLARRPKALDVSDKSAIIVSYDNQSDAFKDIQAKSTMPNSGCQHGVSFLVFEKTTGQFLEVYFGNKSSRPEAKKLYPFLPLMAADIVRRELDVEPHGPLPVTLKSRFAENNKGTWHTPVVVKSLTPISLPSTEVVVKEITKFLTVKSGGVEKVVEKSKTRAR